MSSNRKPSLFIFFMAALTGLIAGIIGGLFLTVGQDLPEINALADYEPGAVTRILSDDGVVLTELFEEKRTPIPLENMPAHLRQAVVAVEDRRFYRHPGLDMLRIFAAAIIDIRELELAQGASTITQQLARNLFLTPDKSVSRKLKEAFLALQIEQKYTKQEILEFYLNQIPFGEGAYGVAAASRIYFDKDISDLSLDECALLAGIPQNHMIYNLFSNPKGAARRRQVVLNAMVREGYISAKEAAYAAAKPVQTATRRKDRSRARQFTRQVSRWLEARFGPNAVFKGGLTVKTTLDTRLQNLAEASLSKGIDLLEARMDKARSDSKPIWRERPQGAIVVLDVKDGRVLAWAEGVDPESSPLDRVAGTPRLAGSIIAPFIHAAAVERGLTQADRVWDAPMVIPGSDDREEWKPENFSGQFEGEITLRRALEVSGNIPAVKLLSRIGLDYTLDLSEKLGLTSPLNRDLTLAVGQTRLTLLETTSAYRTLFGGGLRMPPVMIEEVRDRSGRLIYQAESRGTPAVSPETAFIVTNMMTGFIRDGMGTPVGLKDKPLAGQIGLTGGGADAWFIGGSPDILAGVWLGYDSGTHGQADELAGDEALPIWARFMKSASTSKDPASFKAPPGIIMAPMNRFTGRKSALGEPDAVIAAFRKGTEPTK